MVEAGKIVYKRRNADKKNMLKSGSFWVLSGLGIFYFYLIMRIYKMEKVIQNLFQKKKYYYRRYREMQYHWSKIQKIRHDMRNLYILEISYLQKRQYETLLDHYRKALGSLPVLENMDGTGNEGIDLILDYKAEIAKKNGIQVTIQICGRERIEADSKDMNIILGNLLDNAIEAAMEVPMGERKISVMINRDITALLLRVSNTYFGRRIKNRDGKYMTNKRNKDSHGIGLQSVKSIIKKYEGSMKIEDRYGVFSVDVLLYM